MLNKYANLLTHYCLNIQKGDKILVRSTPLAEPLLKELYSALLQAGAHVEFQLGFENKSKLFYEHASGDQLDHVSDFYSHAVQNFDGILNIMAPYDVNETKDSDSNKKRQLQLAMNDVKKTFLSRSAEGDLKWSLCVFPTESAAQECGMTLSEYESFVYNACFLDQEDPVQAWKDLGATQQRIVDHLNTTSFVEYQGPHIDISFSTKDRIWINSDGKRNMPSGEVFTSPVEDSVNGSATFTCPTIYDSQDVENISLTVKDGHIETWKAEIGQDVLDRVFATDGARYFGEVAIGTNSHIQRVTKNILFDEKIGGTIHMAVGSSYPETGGKNESTVHWDMITDMTSGRIKADGKTIYENGKFLI